MSYNITGLTIKKIKAVLKEDDVKKFIIDNIFDASGGQFTIDRFSHNIISFRFNQDGTEVAFKKMGGLYLIDSFSFSSSYDPGDFPDKIHKLINDSGGELEALYVWEGGDSINKVTIKNKVISSKELNA